MENGEIILYQPNEVIKLEVRLEEESVWLTRHQLALLFDRDVKTIGKHINNALKEELNGFSVVAKFATTASDGKKYNTEHYNLDMILSVGYRVKSSRGIEFRKWSTGAAIGALPVVAIAGPADIANRNSIMLTDLNCFVIVN